MGCEQELECGLSLLAPVEGRSAIPIFELSSAETGQTGRF